MIGPDAAIGTETTPSSTGGHTKSADAGPALLEHRLVGIGELDGLVADGRHLVAPRPRSVLLVASSATAVLWCALLLAPLRAPDAAADAPPAADLLVPEAACLAPEAA